VRLTVFGASGRTGRAVVEQALAAGHHVVAVARRPEAIAAAHPRLEVVRGDVMAPESLAAALAGPQAVLSAIGARTALTRPTTLYSQGTTAILAGMAAAGVTRFVGVTAAPVAPPAEKSALDRYVAHPLLWRLFGGGYADMAAMERLVARGGPGWTVFRPPRLTSGARTNQYRIAVGKPLPRCWDLRRADLAAAMLAALDDTSLINRAVNIAN
jgi:putative NADH-flavin reductase